MPLVPAICTQCGAKIEVDPTQKAWLCEHCGTPFVTEQAITNYNTTYNTTKVEKNTYNVDNTTVVSGNNEVHIHNDEINKLFLIEEGELTAYKGKKEDITVPNGVICIGRGAIGAVKSVNVPASVVEIKGEAIADRNLIKLRFEPNSALKKIGALAINPTNECAVIENFPLTVEEWDRQAFGNNCALVCCLYSKEDFMRVYGDDKFTFELEYYPYEQRFRQKTVSNHIFLFNYKRCVTVNGFKVAIGLYNAVIFAYNGMLGEVVKMPSIVEGVPVTHVHEKVFSSMYLSRSISGKRLKELHLPQKLEEMPDCVMDYSFYQVGQQMPKLFVPSSLKKVGKNGFLKDFEVVFENGYTELYNLISGDWCTRQFPVIAPNLSEEWLDKKTAEGEKRYFRSNEEYGTYLKAEQEKAERKALKKSEYEKEKYGVTIICKSKEWRSDIGRILIRKDGEQKKIGELKINQPLKVKVHPTENLIIAPIDSDGKYSKAMDKALYVPYGCSKCIVADKLFKKKYANFDLRLKVCKYAPLPKNAAKGRYELLVEDFASTTGSVGYFSIIAVKPNGGERKLDEVYQNKNSVRAMVCDEDDIYIEECDSKESRELVEKGCNYVQIKKEGFSGWKIKCSKR